MQLAPLNATYALYKYHWLIEPQVYVRAEGFNVDVLESSTKNISFIRKSPHLNITSHCLTLEKTHSLHFNGHFHLELPVLNMEERTFPDFSFKFVIRQKHGFVLSACFGYLSGEDEMWEDDNFQLFALSGRVVLGISNIFQTIHIYLIFFF